MAEIKDKDTQNPVQMNFNRIYKVIFDDKEPETLKKVTENFNQLTKFKKGNPNNPGEGFKNFDEDFIIKPFIVKPDINFEDYLNDSEDSKEDDPDDSKKVKKMRLEKIISNENILTKRFCYESYIAGRKEAQNVEADIFWIKPCDVLLVKGSKTACEKVSKYLLKFPTIGFDEIKFDHDFLLWILYKFNLDGKLTNDLIIEKIDKGRTHGINTNENDIEFRDGQSRIMPLPTIYGLLNDHKLFHLGGDYKFRDDYKLNVKLATELTMQIYSDHALRGKTYEEKCHLSFPFIIEMIEIFEKWININDEYKYPNDEFFDSAIEEFKEQYENSLEGIGDLKKKYENLRKGVKDAP